MSVGSVLDDIGKGVESGLKTTGRVAGAVLPKLGQGIANEEAGYAPQIAAEGRAHQQKMEDAALAAKEQELTAQLETGRKYGTLTPEQQQQYVDQITGLYSHPRHAGTLMEKLRQAVHPNGAIAGPAPKLASAIPPGGTAAADEQQKEKQQEMKDQAALDLATKKAELAAKYRHPAGRSPAIAGTDLPADAVGPDGQPISPEKRTATQGFIEYGGQFWPAQQKPPVLTTIKGHRVLLDPNTRLPIRDLGPVAGVKITDGGSWAPNGDPNNPQMVWLPKHSVSGPGGADIEVQLSPDEEHTQDNSPTVSPTEKPKPSVGNLLKSGTGARPVSPSHTGGTASSPGKLRTLPGGENMAWEKSPTYKANATAYGKAQQDVIAATKIASQADQVAANPNDAVNQKRLAVALERAASGRFTTQALDYVMRAGWGNTIDQWANNPSTGALPADVMRQLVDGAHENLKAAQDAAKTASDSLKMPPKEGETKLNSKGIKVKFHNGAWGLASATGSN